MIEASVYLFGKPCWEMDIEGLRRINPKVLRRKGDELRERLRRVAGIVSKLQRSGWELWGAYGDLYGLDFFNRNVQSIVEAKSELARLGVDQELVDVHELAE